MPWTEEPGTNGFVDGMYIQPLFSLIFTLAYGIRCLRTPYNIWILAAGHFKQTQRCHVISAALNLLVSILMVWKWGLVGVAIGTLIAMCYQTIWMTVYTVKKLVQHSLKSTVKRYMVDVVAALMIVLTTSKITMDDCTYTGWCLMAIKVAVISVICIIVVSFVFYKDYCLAFINHLLKKYYDK